MKCPFCNESMECGKLYSPGEQAIYWFPNSRNLCDIAGILTKKRIEKADGIVVDKIRKIGFLAKERPNSYYCKSCDLFITKHE